MELSVLWEVTSIPFILTALLHPPKEGVTLEAAPAPLLSGCSILTRSLSSLGADVLVVQNPSDNNSH